jgi:hypothetical protein
MMVRVSDTSSFTGFHTGGHLHPWLFGGGLVVSEEVAAVGMINQSQVHPILILFFSHSTYIFIQDDDAEICLP